MSPFAECVYWGQTRLGGVDKCFGADCLCQREINVV